MTGPIAGMAATWDQVLAWRMGRQALAPRLPLTPEAVASRTCGVQAQVASAAEVAIAARQADPGPGRVERALWGDRALDLSAQRAAPALVKSWAMRGTLHLLAANELAGYCATLGTVRFWETGAWQRYHGVSAADMDHIRQAVAAALAPGPALTREELGAAAAGGRGTPHLATKFASGWGELLKPLAFLGELCHGPPRGTRVTFVRPDRWVEGWAPVDAAQAGPDLVRRFLSAYGPASVADFALWWARSRPKAVRPWFEALAGELVAVEVYGDDRGAGVGSGGRSRSGGGLWLLAADASSLADHSPLAATTVRLLPNFDQYVLAAPRDLEVLVPAVLRAQVFRQAGWVSPVVVAAGRVAGTWKLDRAGPAVHVWLAEPVDRSAIEAEVDHLGTALGHRGGLAISVTGTARPGT